MRSKSSSPINNKGRYANIICTIAVAVLGFMWTTIEYRLNGLDSRLRSVEQQVTAIATRLGIPERSSGRFTFDIRRPAGSGLADVSDPGIAGLYQEKQGLQAPAR